MARTQYDVPEFQGIKPRPMATPTDTFVKPSADRELAGLVEGLAAFSPSMKEFTAQFVQRSAQEQRVAGQEAAQGLIDQGLSLADSTRQGKLPMIDNPWAMAAFHEKMGAQSANDWHYDLIEKMEADQTLQESTSVKDAQDFIVQHKQQWLADHGSKGADKGFWDQGFDNRSNAATQQEMLKFASRLEDKVKKMSYDMHFSQVKQEVINSFSKGSSLEDVQNRVDLMVQGQYSMGLNETKLDETTTNAIIAAAQESGNEKMLLVLKGVRGSKSGAILGDTERGSEGSQKALRVIRDERFQQWARNNQYKDERDKERGRSIMGDALLAKLKDPNSDIKPFMESAKDLPEVMFKLSQVDTMMNNLNDRTDENVRRDLFSHIFVFDADHSQTDEEDVAQARAMNQLSTENAQSLISTIRANREYLRNRANDPFDDFQFKQMFQNISGRFKNQMGVFDKPGASEANTWAEAMFMESWLNAQQNGGIPNEKKAAWLADEYNRVVTIAANGMGFRFQQVAPPQMRNSASKVDLPDDLRIDANDISAAKRGVVTPSLQKQYDDLHLDTPTKRGQFLMQQTDLYIKKFHKNPPDMSGGFDKKKEE
jgi:hypothetical protein